MAIDWDALYELAPSDTTYVKDTDDAIRSLKTATRERVTKEHEFDLASQARQGLHRAGSAVAFYQASAPTQRNGVDLATADAGILLVDSDDKLVKVWDGDSFESIHAVAQGGEADTVDSQHVTTAGNGIRAIHGNIHGSATQDSVFSALSSAIPNTNDWTPLSGGSSFVSGPIWGLVVYARAVRTSSTQITLYGTRIGVVETTSTPTQTLQADACNSGNSTSIGSYVSVAW